MMHSVIPLRHRRSDPFIMQELGKQHFRNHSIGIGKGLRLDDLLVIKDLLCVFISILVVVGDGSTTTGTSTASLMQFQAVLSPHISKGTDLSDVDQDVYAMV